MTLKQNHTKKKNRLYYKQGVHVGQKSQMLCTKETESENLKHISMVCIVPFLKDFFFIIQNLLFSTVQCLKMSFYTGWVEWWRDGWRCGGAVAVFCWCRIMASTVLWCLSLQTLRPENFCKAKILSLLYTQLPLYWVHPVKNTTVLQ